VLNLMEYIKVQWTDIHHTRNQEWKVLVIIIGIFYALFKVNPEHRWLHVAITFLGLIACGMGIYMCLVHWGIFWSKRLVIKACEEKLGIYVRFYKSPFPIQGLILLIYFFIVSILLGWLIWLLLGEILISFITFSICFLASLIICAIAKRKIQETVEKQTQITFRKMEDEK
jgi:hypothetical protein